MTVSHEHTIERMAVALDAFLASLPDGTPAELIEAFGKMVRTDDGVLPPRVFVEAVEQSPLAISITDTSANILYANRVFEQLTGYSQDDLAGNNHSILSHKVTPPEVYRELWGTLHEQKSWNGMLVNRRKDGGRYLADLVEVDR